MYERLFPVRPFAVATFLVAFVTLLTLISSGFALMAGDSFPVLKTVSTAVLSPIMIIVVLITAQVAGKFGYQRKYWIITISFLLYGFTSLLLLAPFSSFDFPYAAEILGMISSIISLTFWIWVIDRAVNGRYKATPWREFASPPLKPLLRKPQITWPAGKIFAVITLILSVASTALVTVVPDDAMLMMLIWLVLIMPLFVTIGVVVPLLLLANYERRGTLLMAAILLPIVWIYIGASAAFALDFLQIGNGVFSSIAMIVAVAISIYSILVYSKEYTLRRKAS